MRLFICLILFVFVLAGCGKKDDKTDATNKSDTKTSESTTIKLPEGFPADIPMYKNLSPVSTNITGKTIMVTLQTSDPAKNVGEFYKYEMVNHGYKPDAANEQMQKDDRAILTFTKGTVTCDIAYRYLNETGKTTIFFTIR